MEGRRAALDEPMRAAGHPRRVTVTCGHFLAVADILLVSDLVDAVLDQTTEEEIVRWYHAAPIAIALTVGSVAIAYNRIRNVEVIA